MNSKNLPLKFLFVALLVGVSLWSLYSNRLRWGIDISGGHSLTFEAGTHKPKIKQLENKIDELNKELATTDDEARKKEIQESITRYQNELERYKDKEDVHDRDLAKRIIEILKKRIDPEGLMSLEWRPQGNRFEVRMPAGNPESQRAKYAFLQSLDILDKGNIRRSDIRVVVRSSGAQRQAKIDQLAGSDSALGERLASLARTYDLLREAQDELARVREKLDGLTETSTAPADDRTKLQGQLDKAQAAVDDLTTDFEENTKAVQESNINPQELQNVLGNYVSKRDKAALVSNQKEITRRREALRIGLDALCDKHPARATEIRHVEELYAKWAELRRRLEDPSDLIRLIAKSGVLEYRMAPFAPGTGRDFSISDSECERYKKSLEDEGPQGARRRNDRFLWFTFQGDPDSYDSLVIKEHQGKWYVLLYNTPNYTMLRKSGRRAWTLAKAFPTRDEAGGPAVGFDFDEAGAKQFFKLTSANIKHVLAVLLDDEVHSAPVIQKAISKSGTITGSFTPQEVDELVRILEAGSLPAKLNPQPVAQSTFGSALGEDNRQRGFRAAYWGLIAVAVLMLVYYLLAGSLADVALLLNIILVLGAMSLLNAVFTLPGIAGIILTIGIAVDANVLIFERLREEQLKGQSIRMALKNAYDRALSAILDSNITTLITCLILGWVGTQEVRGFAITLGLGVMFSMFTALVVTRWVFQLLLDTRILKKPVFMLRFLGVPKINWMSKRHFFWGLSGVFIVLGIASLFWQGKNIWGIDFTAGTQVLLKFEDDALIRNPGTGKMEMPGDDLVRESFAEQARKYGYDKIVSTAQVEKVIDPERVTKFLANHDLPGAGDISPAQWRRAKLDEEFFRRLDADGSGVVSMQELKDRLPQNTYRVSTTETNMVRIRDVAEDAFGRALQLRMPSKFTLAKGESVTELGAAVTTAPNGMTRITRSLIKQANPVYSADLEDFAGGAVFVFRNVSPAIRKEQMSQRIREMRFQVDYAGQMLRQSEVIGLTEDPEGEGFTEFVILVKPSDPATIARAGGWSDFAEQELQLIRDAFGRESAIEATNFDAAIAGETAQRAVFAVVLSWLGIIAYLWFRFGSARWGLAAVVCLIHDSIIVIGLVAVSGWLHTTWLGELLLIDSFKIDLVMIAAILTVIGYSVNDTIVVFDRIRENRGKLTTVSPMVINTSINQTLSRTLMTSGTTFIVVFIMYVWGGPSIHPFNYALLAGILFGTYSSVAVAAPLLMGFRRALLIRTVETVADKK